MTQPQAMEAGKAPADLAGHASPVSTAETSQGDSNSPASNGTGAGQSDHGTVLPPTSELVARAMNSDFLSASPPERRSARLSSALLNYKRPDGLNMIPLGTSWSLDVFARPNNGIRRELIDLYNMVDSMQRRILEVRSRDLEHFFCWWEHFTSFLTTAMKGMVEILIPWACGDQAVPSSVGPDAAKRANDSVNQMIVKFNTIEDQLSRRPPDESMAKIIKGLAHVHEIFEFIEAIESDLPEIAESRQTQKDAAKIEKRMATFLYKEGDKELRKFHLLQLSRGMTDEVASAWGKRIPPLVRIGSGTSKGKFKSQHLGVVGKLALVD